MPTTSQGHPPVIDHAAGGTRRRGPLRRIVRALAVTGAVLGLLAALATLAAVAAGGDGPLRIVLLASLAAYAGPLLLVSALVLLLAGARRLAGLTALVLAITAVWLTPWPASGTSCSDDRAIRALAPNLEFGQADPAQVAAQVRARRVDVLVLTELTADSAARLRAAGLNRLLPNQLIRPQDGAGGTGVWARQPLRQVGGLPATRFAALAVDLTVGGRTTRLFAVHPSPPTDPARWRSDYQALTPVFKQALDAAAAGGPAVVIAGDLNATRYSRPLARVLDLRAAGASAFHDAAEITWPWADGTWPADAWYPPLLRIDHVLHSEGWRAAESADVAVAGTDHQGVFAKLCSR